MNYSMFIWLSRRTRILFYFHKASTNTLHQTSIKFSLGAYKTAFKKLYVSADPSIGFTEKTNTPSIDVYSPGLEYSGLAVSGVGNAAHINISEDGDSDPQTFGPERIARKPFFASSVSSGTVYMSFLANIKTTIGGDFNNFFIASNA